MKLLAYLLTPIYLLCFGLVLLVFQPLQWLAFNLFGYRAQQQFVYALNWGLMRCIHVLGGRIDFRLNTEQLPTGRPYIFAANHQSMNDIPAMIWFLRKYRPVFIAKQELSKNIPSISYNYKCGGAIGIDRKDPAQAIAAISGLGRRAAASGESVCIFPEGSRSRDGQLRTFHSGGMAALLEQMPEAIVVPICIENSWKLVRHGFWPIPLGIRLQWTSLEPIACAGKSVDEVMQLLKSRIAAAQSTSN